MNKIEKDLTDEQKEMQEDEVLTDIVIMMNKEFKNNYDMYIEGSYAKLEDLAKLILSKIAPGCLRDMKDKYIYYIITRFISEIEDLFKYCDGHEEYISVNSEWSNNDLITSGGQYNICQECVVNGYGE